MPRRWLRPPRVPELPPLQTRNLLRHRGLYILSSLCNRIKIYSGIALYRIIRVLDHCCEALFRLSRRDFTEFTATANDRYSSPGSLSCTVVWDNLSKQYFDQVNTWEDVPVESALNLVACALTGRRFLRERATRLTGLHDCSSSIDFSFHPSGGDVYVRLYRGFGPSNWRTWSRYAPAISQFGACKTSPALPCIVAYQLVVAEGSTAPTGRRQLLDAMTIAQTSKGDTINKGNTRVESGFTAKQSTARIAGVTCVSLDRRSFTSIDACLHSCWKLRSALFLVVYPLFGLWDYFAALLQWRHWRADCVATQDV